MNEREFNDFVDEIFERIEDSLEIIKADLDIDRAGNVLTIIFADDSQVILSRQSATQEIWVAARSGGFHLKLSGDDWVCTKTGEDLT